MSHIDSFKHEIVGLFGNVPVYHPLEEIQGDFVCTPKNLVLGGGSGEHPALVIESPLKAVAWFLNHELEPLRNTELSAERFPLKTKVDAWSPIIAPYLTSSPHDILTFYEWDKETYSRFGTLCKSPALPNPLDDEPLETWLILGMGEFVFFAMPHLAPEIMTKLEDPYPCFHHTYHNNIMVIPPNIPVYANGGNAFKYDR
ncbi:hypothetical protein [Desulfoluna sp.]|uniref:hypothetical protein n=1 Tax=Desulfoluna sp. TaxID=2045199 RepID=UPI002609C9E3|nr:hypothetical protein [Desulfoluna sp.]